MQLTLSKDRLAALQEQAVATFPEECCGLLGGTGEERREIRGTHQIENALGDDRYRRYMIMAEDYRNTEGVFEEAGLEVVGVYHSHPDGTTVPTEDDLRYAWPWLVYLIIGTQDGKATGQQAWRLRDDRSAYDAVELVVE